MTVSSTTLSGLTRMWATWPGTRRCRWTTNCSTAPRGLIPGTPTNGVVGPYGLGVRVPLFIVSPWSPGGWVCSETFDHTSLIRFIEARFGVGEPQITPWRRAVCGDRPRRSISRAFPITSRRFRASPPISRTRARPRRATTRSRPRSGRSRPRKRGCGLHAGSGTGSTSASRPARASSTWPSRTRAALAWACRRDR